MGFVNAPPDPPHFRFLDAVLRYLKTALFKLLPRSPGFLHTSTLSYAAHRVCQLHFGQAHPTDLARCRQVARSRLVLNPQQVQHFLQTGVGDLALQWLQPLFHGSDQTTLQDLILQWTADPDGLSLLSLLRSNPDQVQVNLDYLLLTANRLKALMQATDRAIAAMAQCAQTEAQQEPELAAVSLAPWQTPGPWHVEHFTFELQTDAASVMSVFCAYPHTAAGMLLPVVIQSHGLASSPEDLAEYADHLASYGYFVATPQHAGSDVIYAREMLAGRSPDLFAPSDFIQRPQAMTALLDALERDPPTLVPGRLNLQAVGVLGYSFGACTAFALGGAEMDFDQLAAACDRDPLLNTSLLLQCQALALTRSTHSLRDPRIQAILAMEPLGSELFGAQGMQQIQVPVLLISGTHDFVTPLIWEQARLFLRLTTAPRYLVLMQGKSHLRDTQRLVEQLELQIQILPPPPPPPPTAAASPFDAYTKALSLTFFNQHLQPQVAPTPPLTAATAATLSQPPHPLWLISDRSSDSLRQTLQQINEDVMAGAIG